MPGKSSLPYRLFGKMLLRAHWALRLSLTLKQVVSTLPAEPPHMLPYVQGFTINLAQSRIADPEDRSPALYQSSGFGG